MNARVKLELDGGIAVVVLNRPDKYNALDRDAFQAIIDTGERLAANPAIRAVILTGAGDGFCAGIDHSFLSELAQSPATAELMQPRAGSPANFFQAAALVWREMPVPVIAAVHGAAYGAGLQLALGADVRLATADSRWSIMEVRWGLIPDMGITATLRHTIGRDHLKVLACTGKVIDGSEAKQLGLVTELRDDPLAAARLLAREIAERSPEAVRAIKKLVDSALDEPVDRALRSEATLQMSLVGSPNQREAVIANLHKREPDFRDPRG